MPVDNLTLLDPLNRVAAEAAQATSNVEYGLAVIWLAQFARQLVAFWDRFDLLVTPTLAKPSVPVGWMTGSETDLESALRRGATFTPFTFVVNITGQPAISLPLDSDDGHPVGVQLIGRPADESTLLGVAAQLEEAAPWRDRRPSIS